MDVENESNWISQIEDKAAQEVPVFVNALKCIGVLKSFVGQNAAPDAAFFAASLSSVKAQLAKEGAKADEDGTCSGFLMIIRSVWSQIGAGCILPRVNEIQETLLQVLKTLEEVEDCARLALHCLRQMVTTLYDAGARPNRKLLKGITAHLFDARSKVRGAAHHAMEIILQRASGAKDEQTFEFMTNFIVTTLKSSAAIRGEGDQCPAYFLTQLLRTNLQHFASIQRKEILGKILELPGRAGQLMVATQVFRLLIDLSNQPCAMDLDGTFEDILKGLLALELNSIDTPYCKAYLKAFAAVQAVVCRQYKRHDLTLALAKISPLLLEQDATLHTVCGEVCSEMFSEAMMISDDAFAPIVAFAKGLLDYKYKPNWRKIFKEIFVAMWSQWEVRRTTRAPSQIEAWTAGAWLIAKDLVKTLLEAYEGCTGGDINSIGDRFGMAIGGAIGVFGPACILELMPLKFEESMKEANFDKRSRSWLMPIFNSYIKCTNFSIFSTHFLPVASQLLNLIKVEQSDIIKKKYMLLLEQVWALVPGFCTDPLDLEVAFSAQQGQLLRTLVGVIQTRPNLRGPVCTGLASLCQDAVQPTRPLSINLAESNARVLSNFGPRVLKELLESYMKAHTSENDPEGAKKMLQVITSYAGVCEKSAVTVTFTTAVRRMLQLNMSEDSQVSELLGLAELAAALVSLLPGEQMNTVLQTFTPMMQGGIADKGKVSLQTAQKTAYKAIRSLCEHCNAGDADKLGSPTNFLQFWKMIHEARGTCEAAALKARLTTLKALVSVWSSASGLQPHLEAIFNEVMPKLIPELLLSLREVSAAVRHAAWSCLQVTAQMAMPQGLQQSMFTLLVTGLAGSSRHMKSASIDALGRVLFEQRVHDMPPALRDNVIKTVLILVEDKDRQVFKSVLRFIKIVLFIVPQEELQNWMPTIFKMFDSRHVLATKMVIRRIVEKCLKKAGNDIVISLFPAKHAALLSYMLKMQRRALVEKPEKQKEEETYEEVAGNAEVPSDDESDDERPAVLGGKKVKRSRDEMEIEAEEVTKVKALLDAWEEDSESEVDEWTSRKPMKRGTKKSDKEKSSGTWIMEGEDAVDFTSSNAAHAVLASDPTAKRQKKESALMDRLKASGIKVLGDGRIEIVEEPDAEAKKKGGKKDNKAEKPKASLSSLKKLRAQKQMRRLAQKGGHNVKGVDSFAPRKKNARGDAQRGSKLEPYAYMQMNPKLMHEKHKVKSIASIQQVVIKSKKNTSSRAARAAKTSVKKSIGKKK